MKKLFILPTLLLVLGFTGCVPGMETPGEIEEVSVVVEEMETAVEEIQAEEAIIDETLMELEIEEF